MKSYIILLPVKGEYLNSSVQWVEVGIVEANNEQEAATASIFELGTSKLQVVECEEIV